MDYRDGVQRGPDYQLRGLRRLEPGVIFASGQCFRWEAAGRGTYEGIAHGRRLRVALRGDTLTLFDVSEAEFDSVWRDYFDLGRDYGALADLLCADPVLERAVACYPGMRVLRQDGWEALCSFILSQNNNIPRIKGLVARLCECFGTALPGGGHAFPTPVQLAGICCEDLAPVRCGFRAKYLVDAARAVADGRVALEALSSLPLDEAREMLISIRGVGPKVADCALLYGFGRVECVPMDVWMIRVMKRWYPQGLPEAFLPVAGLAQQYLFHYARTVEKGALAGG